MIITLTGQNSFLLKAELTNLIDNFVSEHTDMGLERLDGEETTYDRIREALESLPFLASKKMVVLTTPSALKEFTEKSSELLDNLSEITDVVIVEPKLDKRFSYYKFLKKNTDFREFNELDEQGLSKWLVETAKSRGGNISQSDARYLVERVGANQQLLSNELDKLLAFSPAITRQNINHLTDLTPQSTIFELLDAALSGRTKRALELYQEQRALKVEAGQIIAMLAWQLHVLAIVVSAGDRDAGEIAKQAKLNPFVVRKTMGLAKGMTQRDVKKLVHDTLQLDILLKSQPIDADEAIQNLIMRI